MDKMNMHTANLTEGNIDKIAELFPQVVTEALDTVRSTPEKKVYKKVINFELLKQVLTSDALSGDEAYELTWVGKKQAMAEVGKPIRKTLRPVKADSENWDNTKNIYIEGDNLEALKLLHESYRNKVKMIYIDPPYNTGKDFVYTDKFTMSQDDYDEGTARVDEDGNVNFRENTVTNPRFHSDWCSMIYPRLILARNLLTDDGVVFISIDDNEQSNLKKICDEVFGAGNFVAQFVWQSTAGSNTGTTVVTLTEYIMCYGKNAKNIPFRLEMKNGNWKLEDKYFGTRGKYELQKLDGMFTSNHFSPSLVYAITLPNGKDIFPGGGDSPSDTLWNWRWSKTKVEWGLKNGFIDFVEREDKWTVYFKNYEKVDNSDNERKGSVPPKNTIGSEIASTSTGTNEINSLFSRQVFEFPKASNLVKYLSNTVVFSKNDIILDFFSGSATSAHSVMQLNAEDGGNRKFIMVQLPEVTDEKSEAYKAGFKNICEIGKERIRRAGKKIAEENQMTAPNLDTGFRVFRIDDTNMKDVYYSAGDYTQNLLDQMESNIKDGRTDLDLLYSCLVEWGLTLDLPHKSEKIDGVTVHTVNEGDLIACFDENVPESVVREIANRKPLRAVFRDSSFASSPAKINVYEIFKLLAPNAKVKVL